jgi:hypothetical protein
MDRPDPYSQPDQTTPNDEKGDHDYYRKVCDQPPQLVWIDAKMRGGGTEEPKYACD